MPRRFSRERFRPRLGTITHRQAGRTGGRQATQQVLAVHAGSAFRGSAEQDTRGRHGPVHVEAAHRRLFGAIPACLSPPPPACDRCSSSSPLATSYCTSDGAAPAGPPNTRPTDSSSNLCWALMRLVVQQSPELKLGRRPTPYSSRTTKMTLSGLARAHVSPAPWADGKGEMIDGRGGPGGGRPLGPPLEAGRRGSAF